MSYRLESFGRVAQIGLTEVFVKSDFTIAGSIEGGGDLGLVAILHINIDPEIFIDGFESGETSDWSVSVP